MLLLIVINYNNYRVIIILVLLCVIMGIVALFLAIAISIEIYNNNKRYQILLEKEKNKDKNQYYDDYTPHSEIVVKAPYNSDVIAIVRYNNMNGSVAGHRYIKAGNSSKIYLKNGYNYQTFFYYGKGWYPDKQMNGKVRGGFLKGEAFSKDGSPSYMENQILTYELTLQEHGNFQTSSSSEGEMF